MLKRENLKFMDNLIQIAIGIVPALLAYLGAIYQNKNKLELVKEQNKIELEKVIKQLEEERYKTDQEIEKLKLEKDNDIERMEAETEKEIRLLQEKSKARQGETLENKLLDELGDEFIGAFKENIDFGSEKTMRTEKEILNLVSEFAYQRSNVKIIALEGSRTNENIKKDKFQDYDFAFFVSDIECFTHEESWLSLFGELLFIQKPEDMELFPPDLDYGYSYIMYFKDGIKMDITLINLKDLNRYFSDSDGLVKILVDKDNLVIQEIVPDDSNYWLKKPTEREFYDCCNEFWSVSTYVAKGVFRREILFALDHFNNILRPELLRMISWYIGFNKGFDFSLGKNYKFINKYLTDKEFNMFLATFEMNGYRKTYQSFKLCCELFKYYSNKVSCLGNYNYPNYEKNIENFIRNNYEN